MIEVKKGNLLKSDAEALVNTVNCVGVMGRGIALQFKQAFPENNDEYSKMCSRKKLVIGKVFVFATSSFVNPKFIINFPTKNHWREKSKIEYIEKGLKSLVDEVKRLGIKSISVPPLGCGMGGLSWQIVSSRIRVAFRDLRDVVVYLYEPSGSPAPETMLIRTERPKLTKARALFISLINRYGIPGYKITVLEIQKLAYFLQELGEPLRLRYKKEKYGPYAENLNHVLQVLDGHYIRGYGDRKATAKIYLMPKAADKAKAYLSNEYEAKQRLERVSRIIEGFETPYGLELLATVHWAVKHEPPTPKGMKDITTRVQRWNVRKQIIFAAEHIQTAYKHLLETKALEN